MRVATGVPDDDTSPTPVGILSSPQILAGATLRERAEDLAAVTLSPASPPYSVVQPTVVAEGTSAFHLAQPTTDDRYITLTPSVTPTASSKAFFESRLGWATTTQIARFQVSTNNGTSWSTLWSRTGTGDQGQSAFGLVSVSLAAYAGQSLRLRFMYEFTSGSWFNQTTTNVGWIIDDIQVGTAFIPRVYSGFGDPTPEEVLSVEYLNRARADAVAEATRLRQTTDPDVLSAIDYFKVDLNQMELQFATLTRTTQPLAIQSKLMAAARLHSQDMYTNVFQGHVSSSNPPAPNQAGDTLGTRATRQDYPYSTLAENVYSYAKSVWHAHAGFDIDWGNDAYGMQVPPGHRNNIHGAGYREVGVGIRLGSNSSGGNTVGPMIMTQNFGTSSQADQPFLVGVTYTDSNSDQFYTLGEGLSGVSVTVDGASFSATSSTHGAYAIPLPANGSYTVTFSAAGCAPRTQSVTVSNTANIKLDYLAQAPQLAISPQNRTHTDAAASGQTVGVTANVPWTATPGAADTWITITGGSSGSGNGTVTYSVSANPSTTSRSGTISVTGSGITRDFTVQQDGVPASLAISPSSRTHTDAAASGQTVGVTANVPWTSTRGAADTWITITGGSSGSGNGTVTYSVSANPSTTSRSGTISVTGSGITRDFTVQQDGVPAALAISPQNRTHTGAAASGQTVGVTANVPWTATRGAADTWITITGGSSGSGNGTVTYSVSANSSTVERAGSITVSGGGIDRIFSLTQAAGMPFTVVAPPPPTAAGPVIRWNAAAARTYRVERCTNLAAVPQIFTPVATGIPGVNGPLSHTDITASGPGPFIYKVVEE